MIRINRLNAATRMLVIFVALTLGAKVAAGQGGGQTGMGADHEANILGVRLGMDVPTALEQVFVNAHRKPGQEKPDTMRHEGKDKQDIRVLYKGLEVGDLQILFAGGKWVKEIVLDYKTRPLYSDLRLAPNGNMFNATEGQRYDDRYTIGFTEESEVRRQRIWYRDEKMPDGWRTRVQFLSDKNPDSSMAKGQQLVRKLVFVAPGDEAKFLKAVGGQ